MQDPVTLSTFCVLYKQTHFPLRNMTKRKATEIANSQLRPYVYFLKRGKPQRHELRVTNNTAATSVVLTVKATVTEANLTQGGRFGFYDDTMIALEIEFTQFA